MKKYFFLICLPALCLVACTNRETAALVKPLTTYGQLLQRLDSLTEQVNDSVANKALSRLDSLEEAVSAGDRVMASALQQVSHPLPAENEEFLQQLSGMMEQRQGLIQKLYMRRDIFQQRQLAGIRYHIEQTEIALSNMKPFAYDGLRAMQEETRLQHEQNKAQYQALETGYEYKSHQALIRLEKVRDLQQQPDSLVSFLLEK